MRADKKVDVVAVKATSQVAAIVQRKLRAKGSDIKVVAAPSLKADMQVLESHRYVPVPVEEPLPSPTPLPSTNVRIIQSGRRHVEDPLTMRGLDFGPD